MEDDELRGSVVLSLVLNKRTNFVTRVLSSLLSQFDFDMCAIGSVSSGHCLSSFLASPSVNPAGPQLGSSARFIFPIVLFRSAQPAGALFWFCFSCSFCEQVLERAASSPFSGLSLPSIGCPLSSGSC
jgi:hypothetical protein